jgi:hypothetical protein
MTKKEILEKHIKEAAGQKLGVQYNSNMKKAALNAMQEFADAQKYGKTGI